MTNKKPAKKSTPAKVRAAATKSAHDALVRRVGEIEDNVAKLARALGVDLESID